MKYQIFYNKVTGQVESVQGNCKSTNPDEKVYAELNIVSDEEITRDKKVVIGKDGKITFKDSRNPIRPPEEKRYAEDIQDWSNKWNALPNDVKKSALGEFLKKVANKSGAKL